MFMSVQDACVPTRLSALSDYRNKQKASLSACFFCLLSPFMPNDKKAAAVYTAAA